MSSTFQQNAEAYQDQVIFTASILRDLLQLAFDDITNLSTNIKADSVLIAAIRYVDDLENIRIKPIP